MEESKGLGEHRRMGDICGVCSAVPSGPLQAEKIYGPSWGKVVTVLSCQPSATKSPFIQGGPSPLGLPHPKTDCHGELEAQLFMPIWDDSEGPPSLWLLLN